jgi:hypothetical protein
MMEEDKVIIVNATRGQIEEFMESVLWSDIKRELGAWKKGFEIEGRSIVEDSAETNPSTATVLMHLGDINGRVKTVDYLMSLPDIFLQILEDQKDDPRRNKT